MKKLLESEKEIGNLPEIQVEIKPLDQKLEGEFIKSTKEISNHLDQVV